MFDVEIIDLFPADANGTNRRTYYQSKTAHRVYGPAFQRLHLNGTPFIEEWLLNGKWHRKDGSVWTVWTGSGEIVNKVYGLFLYGLEITTEIQIWANDVGIPDIMAMSEYEIALLKMTWNE